ncbi:MAG TPA: outer membrane lipoprotein-sorting protein [Armatimonadetes bacterium]|jgi:outer membrane lipoprotein-sorting protein|nr:outer membrane lipoprotein-sorting protein [Armatimonadota bacterium]
MRLTRYALCAMLILCGALSAPVAAAPSITSSINTRIRDLQASAVLNEANLAALKKIGKDYADAYRAKTMESSFKEPGKLRFEAKAVGITFTQVVNGNQIHTSVLGIRSTRDISTRPQSRLTTLELGFIAPSALRDYTTKYLRKQTLHNTSCQVYELRYRQKDQRTKKTLLYVDPAKKVLVRRELYRPDGSLKARFTYLNPKQVAPGIWLPTRITVHNGAGELGGVTTYSNFRVNTGLADTLFEGA